MQCHNLCITSLILIFLQLSSDYVGASLSTNVSSKCSLSIHKKTRDFAMKLTSLLFSSPKNENIVMSPLNIQTSLTLILLGSDGSTRVQLSNILGLPRTSMVEKLHKTIRNIFEIGNKVNNEFTSVQDLFIDTRFELREKFVTLSKSIYKSDIVKIDFSHPSTSTVILNTYMANISENRIHTLFENTLSAKTNILISGYAHFKAEWELKFEKIDTIKRTFYLTPGQTISVDTMWRSHSHYEPIHFAEIATLKIQTIRLKFVNQRYSMYIILPDRFSSSLKEFLTNLNTTTINKILNQTSTEYAVAIKLPKISLKWSKRIKEDLKKLGIDEIFTGNSNLNGMVDGNASISTFMHSADIDINEDGVGISELSDTQTSQNPFSLTLVKFFFVDRPFYFFIYDHDIKTVLFHSAVFNPNES